MAGSMNLQSPFSLNLVLVTLNGKRVYRPQMNRLSWILGILSLEALEDMVLRVTLRSRFLVADIVPR